MAKKTYDYLFKIILIGDCNVDKSQLISRFVDGRFSSTFIPTIGVDFKNKAVELNGKKIKLQVWDTPGQERFTTIMTSYYVRGANGVMLVYDVTQEKTFDSIAKWLENIQEHANEDVVTMLLGNKCDIEDERMVSKERGETFAKENGLKFLETSAKYNINVEEAFMTLAADILEKYPQKDKGTQGVVVDPKEGDRSGSKRCF